jgi:DNA oxidative demethylase
MVASGQISLDLGDVGSARPNHAVEVAAGVWHSQAWLTPVEQSSLVEACAGWAQQPGGLRHVRVRNGQMSVATVCLGWHWLPYRYSRTCDDTDGSAVKPMSTRLVELGRRAVAETFPGVPYEPDVALINWYEPTAKMGLHQDKDEHTLTPVVSLSLGDPCIFRFGNTENRGRPYIDVPLHGGDLIVFGGPARLAYHGVPRLLPGPFGGRWNITLRESGL